MTLAGIKYTKHNELLHKNLGICQINKSTHTSYAKDNTTAGATPDDNIIDNTNKGKDDQENVTSQRA